MLEGKIDKKSCGKLRKKSWEKEAISSKKKREKRKEANKAKRN